MGITKWQAFIYAFKLWLFALTLGSLTVALLMGGFTDGFVFFFGLAFIFSSAASSVSFVLLALTTYFLAKSVTEMKQLKQRLSGLCLVLWFIALLFLSGYLGFNDTAVGMSIPFLALIISGIWLFDFPTIEPQSPPQELYLDENLD